MTKAFEAAQFGKHLITLSRMYPGFVLHKDNALAYWDYLHEQCNLPLEALRQALREAPKHHPQYFPTAGQLEVLAKPFGDAIRKAQEREQHTQARAALPPGRESAAEALLALLAGINRAGSVEENRGSFIRALQLLSRQLHGEGVDDVYVTVVTQGWKDRGRSVPSVVAAIERASKEFIKLPTPGMWAALIEGRDLGIAKSYGYLRHEIAGEG